MSVTDLSPLLTQRSESPSPPTRPAGLGTWARVALACAVLVGSGGVRAWQARRVEESLRRGSKAAFDLNGVPLTLGPWVGLKTTIDENLARGTGADTVVTRRYVHQDTGVAVDVILLFGPAVNMFIHLPELCYPAAGYAEVEGAALRPIRTPSGTVPFRSLVYGKGEGAAADLQEVYYTWRYGGRWSPDVGNQKFFERIPGMYKVHLARQVRPGERRQEGNPCEALLSVLVPELERRLGLSPAPRDPLARHRDDASPPPGK